jgi:hypothetical protein
MASDAVVLDHALPCLLNMNHLGFQPQCKHRGMPHSILSLEKILVQNIIMGDMTVVAIGILAV